jgi:predicted metal-binding membrane protein
MVAMMFPSVGPVVLMSGAYCLGCCLGLMLARVAVGLMDLRWMATASAVIAVEKLGPRRRGIPAVVGVGLVLLGIAMAASLHQGAAGASAVRA